MKKQVIHQTYSSTATRTACGLNLLGGVDHIATARPGPKVTCKACQRVEHARRAKARERKALKEMSIKREKLLQDACKALIDQLRKQTQQARAYGGDIAVCDDNAEVWDKAKKALAEK